MDNKAKYNTETRKATFNKGVRHGEVSLSGSVIEDVSEQNLIDKQGIAGAKKSLISRYTDLPTVQECDATDDK